MRSLRVFYSNRVEYLYEKLKPQLFPVEVHPFVQRIIVVPSPAMKAWLMQKFADDPDYGIAMGMQIVYLDQAIDLLRQKMQPTPLVPYPTQLDLAFLIEHVIRQNLWKEDSALWSPLYSYLKVSECPTQTLTNKSAKRLVGLAHKLASLFIQYGIYGGVLWKEWQASENDGWQQEIGRQLLKEFPQIRLPCFDLENHLEVSRLASRPTQVHLFALSFIAASKHRFLTRVAGSIPVSYYIFSPCQAFWSDIASDKEACRMTSYWQKKGARGEQIEALEEYLRNRNPLLANFGRLGREMAARLEESDGESSYAIASECQYEICYQELISEEFNFIESGPTLTLLEAVQADIVLMRNPEGAAKLSLEDLHPSIQFHSAPTIMREVEALYQTLADLFTRHAESQIPLTPADVLVMAPDISLYEPYIKAVFQSHESSVECHIMDARLPSDDPSVQGFMHLLNLPSGRWTAIDILQFLRFEGVAERLGFRREDLSLLQEWVQAAGILWGDTPDHRDAILKREHCLQGMQDKTQAGTWKYGLSKILEAFVFDSQGDERGFGSLKSIEMTQSELAGRFIAFLEGLKVNLQPIYNDVSCSLKAWQTYLKDLAYTYFSREKQEGQGRSTEAILAAIDKMKVPSALLEDKETFAFLSIQKCLEASFQKEQLSYKESQLNAVRFCSMLPMRALPAQVIVLMGMQDGAFPHPSPREDASLNMLPQYSQADYCPTSTHYDRFLFLEALLSARRYFILTYSCGAGAEEKLPSLLITELTDYLDKAYLLKGGKPSLFCTYQHPFHQFDKLYFMADSPLRSYSKISYLAAQAYYGEKAVQKNPFPYCLFQVSVPRYISLEQLCKAARNPQKLWINQTLGIYLENEERRLIEVEEPVSILPKYRHGLISNALHHSFEKVLASAQSKGILPLGLFKEMESKKLFGEAAHLRDAFKRKGFSLDNRFELSFSVDSTQPIQDSKGHWHVPPLRLEYQGQLLHLLGKIEGIIPEGLLLHSNGDMDGQFKAWPLILAFQSSIEAYNLPIEKQAIFFTKDGIKTIYNDITSDPVQSISKYLNFYFAALKNPCPFWHETLSHFLESEPNEFVDKVNRELEDPWNPLYNEYAQWMSLGRSYAIDVEQFPRWKDLVRISFTDLLNQRNRT